MPLTQRALPDRQPSLQPLSALAAQLQPTFHTSAAKLLPVQSEIETAMKERRCETVYDSHDEVVGYNVKYRIGDETGTVRMDEKPGSSIPLKDGQLVLSSN